MIKIPEKIMDWRFQRLSLFDLGLFVYCLTEADENGQVNIMQIIYHHYAPLMRVESSIDILESSGLIERITKYVVKISNWEEFHF